MFRTQPSNQGPTHSSLLCELTRKLQTQFHEYSMTSLICTLEALCDLGFYTPRMRKQRQRGEVTWPRRQSSGVGSDPSFFLCWYPSAEPQGITWPTSTKCGSKSLPLILADTLPLTPSHGEARKTHSLMVSLGPQHLFGLTEVRKIYS